MNRMNWRKQYDGSEDQFTFATARSFEGVEDLAVQSEKDGTDINILVRRFGVTGIPGRAGQPLYGDFSGFDYQSNLDALRAADMAFSELPSDLRDRFNNSPAKLMTFLSNEENKEEAIKLGLREAPAPPPPPVPPIDVRVITDEP